MKQIHLSSFTIDDVFGILQQTGFLDERRAFQWAEDNEFFKYIGTVDRTARFLIAFEDEEVEGQMYVTIVHISLGPEGHLIADYNGTPVFESTDIDAIADYIERRCN